MSVWPNRYTGQTVAITGAGRGIGCATAHRLAVEGGQLVLIDRDADALADVADEIASAGGVVLETVTLDITDADETTRAIRQVELSHGSFDCLVHSAGIVGETNARAADADLGVFKRVIDVNLFGAFIMCQVVLPGMVANQYGRILLIASMAGKEGNPKMSAYAASKAGLIGLAKAMGKEYARSGVTVNALAPAVIATPMNESTDPSTLEALCEKIPMGRMGTTDEATAIIAWICSAEASFNTATVFDLSGGRATY